MREEEKELELALIEPDLSRQQITELCTGRRWADYRKAKIQLLFQQADAAVLRQRRMGQAMRRQETRFVDGPGQHRARIDEFLYHAMRLMYGTDCWRNKDKREHIYRKFPEMLMPSPAPRFIQVNGFKKSKK